VVGPVGSGKSSLLSAILGEIPKKTGIVKLNGTTGSISLCDVTSPLICG